MPWKPEFEGRTHGSIIAGIPDADDPVGRAIVDFIARHTEPGAAIAVPASSRAPR
jgi:hypothetical protein